MLSIEPTDRSIWRMTMISTMPVVITAMDEVCTEQDPEVARRQERAAEQAVAGPRMPL